MFGPQRTLFYSAIIVVFGHLALSAIPGLAGVGVGLVLIALGSGGVKASATSLVGSLYDEYDERRDAGFSVFYMGINLGALVGPLLTGLLQKEWDFHFGFALAAIGMAVGLAQYSAGRKNLPESTHHVKPAAVGPAFPLYRRRRRGGRRPRRTRPVHVITADRLSTIVIWLSVAAAVAYFLVILTDKQISNVERKRVYAFIPMFLSSAVFWSLYQQQFTVVTLYADERLNRNLFGWEMPVSWVQSINPVFIIVLAGGFAALWTKLGDRQPASPVKFALGTMVMGAAFLMFLLMPTGENSVPLLGLGLILLVFTVAELLLSPVGLSLATKLAPERFHTQMVALFFLSIALGTAMSGRLRRLLRLGQRDAVLPVDRRRGDRRRRGRPRHLTSGRTVDGRRPLRAHSGAWAMTQRSRCG